MSKNQTLEKVAEFLHGEKQNIIFTPNPEMLVDAQKDKYFKTVLNSGDLNVCDGFGLSLVSGVKRYPGVELMLDICALAEKENKSVYFLGSGDKEVISNLQLVIKEKYSDLKIAGAHPGPKLQVTSYKLQVDEHENNDLVADISMTAPDILFVAFGHGKQEKWIHENLKDLPSVRIAMGVGGSFDFISGKVKRAPLFIRKIGLEWMYRLAIQPSRFGRIFKATFVFIYYFLKK
ncbi:MAG: WecB/TagA/CpsF family glycosyltransferase [Candidatus Magasanikiibacteriota bacterium]